jgi:hypothetical protein
MAPPEEDLARFWTFALGQTRHDHLASEYLSKCTIEVTSFTLLSIVARSVLKTHICHSHLALPKYKTAAT